MSVDDKSEHGTANGDMENHEAKLKYPRAIPFIISSEFCERFNYYGLRTILVLYLTRKLMFSDDTATIIFHAYSTLVYFCCIVGAIIADSWWGKFKTILWLSFVYAVGSIVVAIGAIEPWNMPATAFTIIGLVLISIGSGGIKPCVAALGGEQFTLPQQAKQLAVFFSLFYFSINLGSFISSSVTPILREDVHCFGMNDCFPLGFGLPAILMFISIVIYWSGKFLYNIVPPQGNMLVKVACCIWNAISTKRFEKKINVRNHWLDYAEGKYGKKLVMETKILLNVLVLYLPLPFFWALYDQQGSRWTFQATRMDGDMGFYIIKPDQMQVLSSILVLLFIPLYEVALYPLLNLVGVRRPLQKMALGGILAGVSFLCSMGVEINLERTYAVLPKASECQVRFFNGLNCDFNLYTDMPTTATVIESNSYFVDLNVKLMDNESAFRYNLTSTTPNCEGTYSGVFELQSKTAKSYFIRGERNDVLVQAFDDDPEKSRFGTPLIRVLGNTLTATNIVFKDRNGITQYNEQINERNLTDIEADVYEIFVGEKLVIQDVSLKHGGVYTIVVTENAGDYFAQVFTVTDANSLSMLWLIPQYVVMILGEVMYSITGLQFSFTQAPESMRSVLQGCWLLTVAVGNLIVTIIVGAKFFDSQIYEFALFAGLMFVDMAVFIWLAIRYTAIPLDELEKVDQGVVEEKRDSLDIAGKLRD